MSDGGRKSNIVDALVEGAFTRGPSQTRREHAEITGGGDEGEDARVFGCDAARVARGRARRRCGRSCIGFWQTNQLIWMRDGARGCFKAFADALHAASSEVSSDEPVKSSPASSPEHAMNVTMAAAMGQEMSEGHGDSVPPTV